MSEEADEARVHAMIAEACLGASSEAEWVHDLRAYLEARGVAAADVEAIVGAPPRLALYRRLVRNNLTGVTEKMLARTRARLGAFDATFTEFLEARGPRTHYLRDVPGEFLAWAAKAWAQREDVPAWALDLARHELAEYEVAAARAPTEAPPVDEIALDRPLVFAEPLRLMRYAFAVHELPEDVNDRTEPALRPTTLLAYRDADHDVLFLELTPLAAALTAHLLEGVTLGEAVTAACAELGVTPSEPVMSDVSQMLASFAERGIVLGARPR